mmetsp:Transcript_105836/g.338003  ORF Transcript_105836/g.338003 Transcript_105836/m.338003 type:complete len:99 (+) Transcript_105836:274-570(+)
MVDECIDQSDMGVMSLDGIFECSREIHFGRPQGARAGRYDDLAFMTRKRASTPRNGEEQREHFTEEEPTKHASACVQHSWCTARAGGRVAPDGVHVVS